MVQQVPVDGRFQVAEPGPGGCRGGPHASGARLSVEARLVCQGCARRDDGVLVVFGERDSVVSVGGARAAGTAVARGGGATWALVGCGSSIRYVSTAPIGYISTGRRVARA
eukprot:209559-Rhodomonas_salina.1